MILPHPESNFSLNIMVLGSEIINELRSQKHYVLIEDLLHAFLVPDDKRTSDMFINTLSFLYGMGLIDKKGFRVKLIYRNQAIQQQLF